MRGCLINIPYEELSPQDRRELRNFQRFLRLWPEYGLDLIQRPRWQKYLGLSPEEVAAINDRIDKEIKR